MADVIQQYYEKLFDLLLSPMGKIKVRSDFYGQMQQINKILKNDYTALISSILEFMVEACTVDLTYDTNNENYTKVFETWKKEVNSNLNLDIPSGLRSLTEQYFRERFKSSFIVLRGKWGKINGIWMPTKMWLMDGSSIYVKNDGTGMNTMEYFFGKPEVSKKNQLISTPDEFILIRKPYNQWTDETPTPYLVKIGALYHALLKSTILDRQAEIVGTTFPMGFFIKAGCEEAMRTKMMPTEDDLKKLENKFKDLRSKYDTEAGNRGLVGAFPFDVSFENLIPDYVKALDEKILKGTDKNILSALGLIEFKGFSSNREEAILNPKVLVERCEDSVLDWVELQYAVVALIKEKNNLEHQKTSNIDVRIHPSIIKSFVDDKMRALIRNWYDRGLVAKKDAIENTTSLNFETQINHRDLERKLKLNERMYPPVTQNLEQNINDPSEPINENIPDDKKPNTPESKNYKNAIMDGNIICGNCGSEIDFENEPEEGMGYIKCPVCEINIDQEGKYNKSVEYLQAPYTKDNYPPQLKNLPVGARNLWIKVFNRVLSETNDETQARQAAWHVVKQRYHKEGNRWVRNK